MRLLRTVLFIAPLVSISPAFASGLAFVVNSGGASISLVDMSSQKELRRIPVLREPHHVALSPDGKSLLVSEMLAGRILSFPIQADGRLGPRSVWARLQDLLPSLESVRPFE